MKYKIVVDSASDLTNSYLKEKGIEDIGFEVCPLILHVNNQDYIDDENLNIEAMLEAMNNSKTKSTSACPSPDRFAQAFSEAEYAFCITVSSKLSGSYNSAFAAIDPQKNHVHIIDSKLVGGTERLIVDKLVELIHEGLSFDEIKDKIEAFRDNQHLFFVIQRFDNLIKNGRMGKLAAIVATAFSIRPLCEGVNGEIQVIEKIRSATNALRRLVIMIGNRVNDFSDRVCIVSHCQDPETADQLASDIRSAYPFKEVIVSKMRGLCSFYALEKGIIVTY